MHLLKVIVFSIILILNCDDQNLQFLKLIELVSTATSFQEICIHH
jgi:hypothetical protein